MHYSAPVQPSGGARRDHAITIPFGTSVTLKSGEPTFGGERPERQTSIIRGYKHHGACRDHTVAGQLHGNWPEVKGCEQRCWTACVWRPHGKLGARFLCSMPELVAATRRWARAPTPFIPRDRSTSGLQPNDSRRIIRRDRFRNQVRFVDWLIRFVDIRSRPFHQQIHRLAC